MDSPNDDFSPHLTEDILRDALHDLPSECVPIAELVREERMFANWSDDEHTLGRPKVLPHEKNLPDPSEVEGRDPNPYSDPHQDDTRESIIGHPDGTSFDQPDEGEAAQVAELRSWATERGAMPGRDAVRQRFECGSGKANRLREAAKRPVLSLAVEARDA